MLSGLPCTQSLFYPLFCRVAEASRAGRRVRGRKRGRLSDENAPSLRTSLSLVRYSRDDLYRGRTFTCWNNEPFTAHLVHYTSVFFPPAVVRLLTDTKAPTDFTHEFPAGQLDLGFPKLLDDFLRAVPLLRHSLPLKVQQNAEYPNSTAGLVYGGQVSRAAHAAGTTPSHLITDHGTQFTDKGFRKWCTRRGIRQRFGAIGKYGSIAVVERFMRTLKNECTRCLLVPYQRTALRRELAIYGDWYNGHRPHDFIDGMTPDEIYYDQPPANRMPRFEPRPLWPRGSPCAKPQAAVRGRCGNQVDLEISYLAGRKHLPIVDLKRVA